MLPKAHLTSHPRMSGSRRVITASWLSGSLRLFLRREGRGTHSGDEGVPWGLGGQREPADKEWEPAGVHGFWMQLEAWACQPPGMGWGWGRACDHAALATRLGLGSEPGRLGPGAPMAQGQGVEAEGEEEAAIRDRASEGGPGTRSGLVPVLQVERA